MKIKRVTSLEQLGGDSNIEIDELQNINFSEALLECNNVQRFPSRNDGKHLGFAHPYIY
jgi:hypothetical protein